MVRRFTFVLLAVASVIAAAPVVAGAGPTKSISYTLSGSSQWNATDLPTSFAISGDVTDGNRTVGTYSGTISVGTYGPCADNPYGPTCAPVTGGTITFTVRGGSFTTSVVGGTVYQLCCPGPGFDEYVFDLSLSVTGGTHAYASAQGSLSLHYSSHRDNLDWDPLTDPGPCGLVDITTCPITDTGTLTGTISR